MNSLQALGRDVPRHELQGVARPNPHVHQPVLRRSLSGFPRVLLGEFDTHVVMIGILTRRVLQKESLPRANLHRDGVVVPEDLAPRKMAFDTDEVERQEAWVDRLRIFWHGAGRIGGTEVFVHVASALAAGSRSRDGVAIGTPMIWA